MDIEHNIKYRGDIDGLRAVAVTAVILYHAFPKFIKGGFVGVDIFFVISGYLISSIIFKNLDTDSFSIYNFYERRIKRIFPALCLVLISCLIFGWFVLTDVEYTQLGKHAKANFLFYINFVLKNEVGYFDNLSNTKPLLHLWSLSIEEQFYIFWPLTLYFTSKKGFNLISICVVTILLSFFLNIRTISKNNISAFYLPLCRIWELISGALLAAYLTLHKVSIVDKFKKGLNHYLNIVIYKHTFLQRRAILRDVSSIIGFLINLSCIAFKKTTTFPGWYVILPVTGALLTLAAGPDAWINKNILSTKLMIWIGLISYPLYLWHWPLLSFAHILECSPVLGKKMTIAILLLSLLLAWATYRLIEKPIRSKKQVKSIVAVLCGALLLIGVFGHLIYKHKGYAFRKGNVIINIPIGPYEDKKKYFKEAIEAYSSIEYFILVNMGPVYFDKKFGDAARDQVVMEWKIRAYKGRSYNEHSGCFR